MGILKRLIFLSVLCIILFGLKCPDKIAKVVIYHIPLETMYYASMTEGRLKTESELEVSNIENKKQIKTLHDAFNELKQDSLLATFNKLDLRLVIEGYNSKNKLLFKVGLDKCGNYQIDDKFYLTNKRFKTILEDILPDFHFLDCSFAK